MPSPTDMTDAALTDSTAGQTNVVNSQPRVARKVGHPLGPILVWKRLGQPLTGRLYAAGILAGTVAILAVAARLHPNQQGMGTHRELGLPPCGFVLATGYPCPTCGMTTAFACAVRGQFRSALRSQVAGLTLALGTAIAGVLAGIALVRGGYPGVNWYRVDPVRMVWLAALFLVLSWALRIGLGLADGSLPVQRMSPAGEI